MARTPATYFVRIGTYWQNSPYRFVGPFATREEAEAAIEAAYTNGNVNVWRSSSMCGGDIKTAICVYGVMNKSEAFRAGMRDIGLRGTNMLPRIPVNTDELFDYEQAMSEY
jgi:hypothetical protein